ncbi:hypothetical protein WJR50_18915 [Catalinimonas sp. 4WD22]|uniref:hypothetical protein n=1 Tax=Catalinimonas locisalis TaxID=3133978 RepID=UPI003101A0DE
MYNSYENLVSDNGNFKTGYAKAIVNFGVSKGTDDEQNNFLKWVNDNNNWQDILYKDQPSRWFSEASAMQWKDIGLNEFYTLSSDELQLLIKTINHSIENLNTQIGLNTDYQEIEKIKERLTNVESIKQNLLSYPFCYNIEVKIL